MLIARANPSWLYGNLRCALWYHSFQLLHDRAPAGLLAAAAVTGLSAAHGLRLDDSGDGRGGASRHDGKVGDGFGGLRIPLSLTVTLQCQINLLDAEYV